MWKPEFLSMILSAAVSLLTLFTFFQSRMTSTEKRLTILEEKNKQNDKELEETKTRLDNHDLQMQVLIQMTEQIKNLSEKVDKIGGTIMINWKLRFQNKATLLAIASTVILLIQQLGFKLPDNIADIVNTFLTLLVLLGVINDPTTAGVGDSPKALTYAEPKKGTR